MVRTCVAAVWPLVGGPDQAEPSARGARDPGTELQGGPVVAGRAEGDYDVPRSESRPGSHPVAMPRSLSSLKEWVSNTISIAFTAVIITMKVRYG